MKDGNQSTESFSIWPKIPLIPIEPSSLEASDVQKSLKQWNATGQQLTWQSHVALHDVTGVEPSVVEGTYNYSH